MRLRKITDKSQLKRFLSTNPTEALYFLGDLDDYYFPKCEWFFVEENDAPRSVILLYKSSGTTLLVLGDIPGVDHFLTKHLDLLPAEFYSAWFDRYDALMTDVFVIPYPKGMLRMSVTIETFKPDDYSGEIIELDLTHKDEVIRLLKSYPDNFFEEYQLATGYYRGIFMDNKLVAMAGVHTASVDAGVAAIGNVVTDAEYRKRGLAGYVTSEVVAALLKDHDLVGLNVGEDNQYAVHTYARLGFEVKMKFREGYCHKRK